MEINRYWYSETQKSISGLFWGWGDHTCHVLVDGEWREYSEWTTSLDGKCNWDDAVLVAESKVELPVMINGVIQNLERVI